MLERVYDQRYHVVVALDLAQDYGEDDQRIGVRYLRQLLTLFLVVVLAQPFNDGSATSERANDRASIS